MRQLKSTIGYPSNVPTYSCFIKSIRKNAKKIAMAMGSAWPTRRVIATTGGEAGIVTNTFANLNSANSKKKK